MLPFRVPLLRREVPFSPAQLFAKGATGAWYDPSSLWGAADHLPRRNLLTYSEDFSNAAWVLGAGTAKTSHGHADAFGGTSASLITSSVANGVMYQVASASTALSNTPIVYTLYVKQSVSPVTVSICAITNTGNTVIASQSFTTSADWQRITLSFNAGTLVSNLWVSLGASSTFGVGEALYICCAQLSLASTTDQSYQRVTDWTTELFAHAAQKNVPWLRRNLLTYSEDFSNAVWSASGVTKTSHGHADVFGGNTASLITSTSGNGALFTNVGGGTAWSNSSLVFTIYVKQASTPITTAIYALTNSANTAIASQSFTTTGDWQKITLSFNAGTLVSTFTVSVGAASTFTSGEALYICCAQLSVGSATYQPIGASWEAQFAANAAAAGVPLTMYTDSAGTTPVTGPDSVVGKLNDLSGLGYHAIQSGATGLKPTLRLSPNGYWYIQRDLSDDALVTTFPNLGTACALYLNDGSNVIETTGITLNGALTQNTPAADYGRIYLNAPSSKAAQITKWLKAKAGMA